MNLRWSRDGTVFVCSFVHVFVTLESFTSLWAAVTLHTHKRIVSIIINESVHRKEQHNKPN